MKQSLFVITIWDTYLHSGNGHGPTEDIDCDGYHKYKVGHKDHVCSCVSFLVGGRKADV